MSAPTNIATALLELAEAVRTCNVGGLMPQVPPSLKSSIGWARVDTAIRFARLPISVRLRAMVEDWTLDAILREIYK